MNDKKYNIIYADPPWMFNSKHSGGSMISGAAQKYSVMSVDEICNLPVANITDANCALVMWWVAAMPVEALQVVKSWGFTLKTMTGFTWVKKTKHGKDFFGMGYYTRQQAENALVAVKGKPQICSHSVRQLIYAANERHSEKPAEVRDKIVDLCGDVSRIELFARQRADGWDAWGKEVKNAK